jgi:hypothetical protein
MNTSNSELSAVNFQQIDDALSGLNDYWNGVQCPELERRIIAVEQAIDALKKVQQ